jgi:hypothetical protein
MTNGLVHEASEGTNVDYCYVEYHIKGHRPPFLGTEGGFKLINPRLDYLS